MEFVQVIRERRSIRKFTDTPVEPAKIYRALELALIAPNSSNMQPWEFYWVRSQDNRTKIVEACFRQNAAKTAQELIFVVARIDTWQRNQKLILKWIDGLGSGMGSAPAPKILREYYEKLIPLAYWSDPFWIKDILSFVVTTTIGFFRPVPRVQIGRAGKFEVAVKSTALACENLMLALVDQGLSCCPMEGFDEWRIKKILKLNRHCRVVMGIGIGYAAEDGLYSEQFRIQKDLVIKEV